MKYVAYYRVSTTKQEQSGLGLAAQRETVLSYIRRNGNQLIGEYTETESGRNNKRPELLKAIQVAKDNDAILVIAKLDRLSRNLTFISTLIDTKIKFVCCDFPEADEATIGVWAVWAQREAKLISIRTKEGLAAKRRREPSWKPGTNNLTDEARAKAHASTSRKARTDKAVRHAYHYIKPLREQGMSYRKIADALNTEGYKTRKGKDFKHIQVYNIWKRFEQK